MQAAIVILEGDGIGPEIVKEARAVLSAVAERFNHDFVFHEHLIGGIAIDRTQSALPPATLRAAKAADAVLLGAVGGPKWDDPSAQVRPEQGLLAIRKELGLYANLRPVNVHPALIDNSPLRRERLEGVDLVVVRELTGGIYFGEPRLREALPGGGLRAVDTLVYTDSEIRRVLRVAFEIARGRKKKLTSVDKANVLESSRLWRQMAEEVSKDFPDVALEHQLVDSAAMRLVSKPADFDVIVSENMFGDILTDEASVVGGSLGLLPSASLGEGRLGLYEPIHGSAPDIAGKGIANPLGTILSAALLLRYSLELEEEARCVEQVVYHAVNNGLRSADLGGKASTHDVGGQIVDAILGAH